jgi:serine/threonine protein kinase
LPTSKLEISRGDILASKYEVLDLLDESPLGLTYRVKHLKSGKFVRLILLRSSVAGPEHQEHLKDAFKEAKALQHPNIAKVGELGDHEGISYYTMEDFEGSTLRELLQEYKIAGKQFALKDAAQVLIQILEGLSSIHDTGRVMRSLRPEYILVNVRYTGPRRQNFVAQVKLVGPIFWDLVPSAILTEDEFTRGEAQYIAPELKSFEPVPSPRCDLYSAGVCFYEMLTGTAPIGTFQLPTTLRPELPKHINDVVELSLANSPDDRYQSARDLIHNVQRTFEQPIVEDPQVSAGVRIAAMVGGIAFVVAIGGLLYAFKGNPELDHKVEDQTLRTEISDFYANSMASKDELDTIYAKHPKGMVYIPPGPYVNGRLHSSLSDGSTDANATRMEPLANKQSLPGFMIDAFEYPNQMNAVPKARVTGIDADRICAEQGKRLCSAMEWEKACKGGGNLVYSYGDTWDPELCGEGFTGLNGWKSGANTNCRSQWGVFDMSGGFAEWTGTAPKGDANRLLIKGGNINVERGTRCAFSTDESIAFTDGTMSFRCCRDLDAALIPTGDEPAPK